MTQGLEDLDEDEKKPSSRAGIIIFVVVALGAVAGGFYVRHHMQVTAQQEAHQAVSVAWAAFQRCLIGPPLAAGENLTLRIHRVEVNRDPAPRGGSTSDINERWPYRCAAHATAIRDAVGGYEPQDANTHRLHDAAEHARAILLQGQTETARLRSQQPSSLEAVWTAATALAIAPANPGTGPEAPTVSHMLLRTDFHPLFNSSVAGEPMILSTDRTPAAELHVAFAQHTLYGCEFAAGADTAHAFGAATCTSLGAVVSGAQVDVSIFDSDDSFHGFPPTRVGAGHDAIVAGIPHGAAVGDARPWAFRGSVAHDGSLTIVDSGGVDLDTAASSGHWHMTRTRAAGTAGFSGALTLPPESSRPDVLPERVLYLASSEPGHGPARVGLFSRILLDNAGTFGPPVDVGTVPEDTRIVGRCHMGNDLAVALTAPGKLLIAMAFGQNWRPISTFDGHLNALDCGSTTVTATWVDARPPSIHQVRCTPLGCTTTEASVPTLASVIAAASGSPEIEDLDGTLVMAWSPSEGGIRMRLAPLAQINLARDVIVYDDHAHLGGWALSPTLYARGTNAVLAFIDAEHENDKQPFALRIGRDGTFSPVTATAGP